MIELVGFGRLTSFRLCLGLLTPITYLAALSVFAVLLCAQTGSLVCARKEDNSDWVGHLLILGIRPNMSIQIVLVHLGVCNRLADFRHTTNQACPSRRYYLYSQSPHCQTADRSTLFFDYFHQAPLGLARMGWDLRLCFWGGVQVGVVGYFGK